ncbi:MAG: thioredoxin family protein [Candidatus Paracaedibacteraceae bacterium]|nr:thioredoxin family protein [Candidatus Paracaedibacteraceae bacterium]
MRFIASAVLFLVVLIQSLPATQATLEYTQVELLSEVETIKPETPFWVVFKITMKPGWHTYWKNPGDSGMETLLTWDLPEGFSASPIQWLPPETLTLGPVVSYGYSNESFHLVQITPPKDLAQESYSLKLKADWLVCEETCIPESASLSLTVMTSKEKDVLFTGHKALIDELVNELPDKPNQFGEYRLNGENIEFYLPEGLLIDKKISEVSFYPEEKGSIKNGSAHHWFIKDNRLIISMLRDFSAPDRITSLVKITDADNKEIKAYQLYFGKVHVAPIDGGLSDSLWGILLFAFLGGLILNAMPCVFPVLSLKAVSIAGKAKSHQKFIRQQGLLYTLGVFGTFLAMASILILLKSSGESVGWGFQMQNPYFIAFMAYLMFFVGLNLSGFTSLPALFGTTQASIDETKSPWSSFWIGVLAVLVATPCTAPFMGIAIGYALGQSALIIFLVFLALGLGFAMPYLLISLIPLTLRLLPKPGRWMETFKEFMAFPMYLTVAWLLWVLVQQSGSRGLITCLIGLIGMAFSFWFWHRFTPRSVPVRIMISLFLTGLTLSPMIYVKPALNLIQTEKFSRHRLQELRAQGRPVFVYATAAWCITCKANEIALKSPAMQLTFKNQDITLLEADWTNQDPEITDYLKSFSRSGVPLYVYYPPQGDAIILPQLLTESIIVGTLTNGGK